MGKNYATFCGTVYGCAMHFGPENVRPKQLVLYKCLGHEADVRSG